MWIATTNMSTAKMLISTRPETKGVSRVPPAAPAMPEMANISPAFKWTSPARRRCKAPASAAAPTTNRLSPTASLGGTPAR